MRRTLRALGFRGTRHPLQKIRSDDDWSPPIWVFVVWVLVLLLLLAHIVFGM